MLIMGQMVLALLASVSVTTVADNCWVFDGCIICTITCQNTQRWNVGGWYNVCGGADTNAPKTPAGYQTMSWTYEF